MDMKADHVNGDPSRANAPADVRAPTGAGPVLMPAAGLEGPAAIFAPRVARPVVDGSAVGRAADAADVLAANPAPATHPAGTAAAAVSGRRATIRPAPPIEASIEALVLRGFPAVDSRRVHAAFAAELESQLRRAGPALSRWPAPEAAAGPPLRIHIGRTLRPETLGREIARVVFRSLNPTGADAP